MKSEKFSLTLRATVLTRAQQTLTHTERTLEWIQAEEEEGAVRK
jgi:hypothetical protein